MPTLIKAAEAAELLGLSVQGVYRLGQQGKIARYVLGPKCVRFSREDIDDFLETSRQPARSIYDTLQEMPY